MVGAVDDGSGAQDAGGVDRDVDEARNVFDLVGAPLRGVGDVARVAFSALPGLRQAGDGLGSAFGVDVDCGDRGAPRRAVATASDPASSPVTTATDPAILMGHVAPRSQETN